MDVKQTGFSGLLVIQPKCFSDEIANPIVSARDSAYPALRRLNRESLSHLGGDSKDNAR